MEEIPRRRRGVQPTGAFFHHELDFIVRHSFTYAGDSGGGKMVQPFPAFSAILLAPHGLSPLFLLPLSNPFRRVRVPRANEKLERG